MPARPRAPKPTTKPRAQPVSYYTHHVFFCCNDRGADADRPSCAQCGSQELRDYAKARMKQLGLHGQGQVRVNQAGCLDRCEEGPVCVVYPGETWYTYIDEIINEHLLGGNEVDRLKI